MLDQHDIASATFVDGTPYALGFWDPAQLTGITGCLEDEETFTVIVPSALSEQLRHDPAFLEGCQFGYECYDEKPGTYLTICNFLCQVLREELQEPHVDFDTYLWVIGYALGWLAGVAETEPNVACVGILHLCFLWTHINPSCLGDRSARLHALRNMGVHHRLAMKAYRACVEKLTRKGLDLRSAYQRALSNQQWFVKVSPSSRRASHGVVLQFRPRCNHEQ